MKGITHKHLSGGDQTIIAANASKFAIFRLLVRCSVKAIQALVIFIDHLHTKWNSWLSPQVDLKGLFIVDYSHVFPWKEDKKLKYFQTCNDSARATWKSWTEKIGGQRTTCNADFFLSLHENNSVPLLTQKHRKKRHFSSRIVGKDQKEKSTYCPIQLYTLNWTQTCYQGWMISVSSHIHAIEIDAYVLFLGLVEAIASQFLSCLPPYYFEVGFQRCARIQFF